MLQLAREQRTLEQQRARGRSLTSCARSRGACSKASPRRASGSKKRGVSRRSFAAVIARVGDASKKVEDATKRTQAAQSGQKMATAMRDAGDD